MSGVVTSEMLGVSVSPELHQRVGAFRPILEAVLEETVSYDRCVEIVLERGLEVMVADLMGTADPNVLLATIQQLAARHPEQVYGFVAEIWRAGDSIERQKAKKRIGFGPPDTPETDTGV